MRVPPPRVRIGILSALLIAALGALVRRQHWYEPVIGPALTRIAQVEPPGPTVIFVVLDTVRADHLSLCGYTRPTSPELAALAARGAAYTCGGVAPAAWTVPSHATYFTGVDTPVHGADFADVGHDTGDTLMMRPLAAGLPTLAEIMHQAGFETAAVGGNPILPGTGLLRGFDVVDTATSGLDSATQVQHRLRDVLRFELGGDRPLFLFVNLADAHDPWPGVPGDLGWASETAGYAHERGSNPDGEFTRFIEQKMSAEEKAAYLVRLTDLYDVGVLGADAGLGAILDILREHGWLSRGYRLVVTSDHGEHLGEGDLLDHGRFATEEAVRVPVVVFQDPLPVGGLPPLPERLWAGHVFELVRDGRLPENLVIPHAIAIRDRAWRFWFDRPLGDELSVAVYAGDEKLMQQGDRKLRFDLATDPSGSLALPVVDGPLLSLLDATVEAAKKLDGREVDAMDPAVTEALRAAGYVE